MNKKVSKMLSMSVMTLALMSGLPSISWADKILGSGPMTYGDNIVDYEGKIGGSLPVSVKNFSGVDPTGVANSTAGIAAAIAAVPNGGTLYFPCGTYLVSGAGTEIFLRSTPIRIVGEGMNCTRIMPSELMANSVDVFRFVPDGAVSTGWYVGDIQVTGQNGIHARHCFNWDSTTNNSNSFTAVVMERFHTNCAGMGVYAASDAGGANANGGLFDAQFRDYRMMHGGFSFNKSGDSLRMSRGIISGAGHAVFADLKSGAAGFIVEGNNISAASGIEIKNAWGCMLVDNEIEQQVTNTGTNNAVVDVGTTFAAGCQIRGGNISVLASVGDPTPIRIGAGSLNTTVDEVSIAVSADYAPIEIVAGASGTRIGEGITCYGNTVACVDDSGTGTQYTLTYTAAGTPGGSATFPGKLGANQIIKGSASAAPVASSAFLVATKIQSYKVNGSYTYTPSAGMQYVLVECVGPGGGGAGVAASPTGISTGGGGSSGTYSRVLLTAAQIGASKAIVIGVGGAGGATGANNGSAGSAATTVGTTLCTANPGTGGTQYGANVGGDGGATAGAGTGDFVQNGVGGGPAFGGVITTINGIGGRGGHGPFGGSAKPIVNGGGAAANGVAGVNCGSGGSGASSVGSASTGAGGAGADGCVIFTEFTNRP